MPKQYWIFKTEPGTYSIDDLSRERVTEWWGIRNYQARNFLRDTVRSGDRVLLYHSNAKEIGIAGLAAVEGPSYPDSEQFRKKSHYYDPKSARSAPRWVSRDLRFIKKFPRLITLSELKGEPKLRSLWILRRGNRLSVTPVSREEYRAIMALLD
jgi:predicted RNA-binding protein with PUA-like domain